MLTFFIHGITELPLYPPIALNTIPEQRLFQDHKLRYIALSLFLRWIRLGEQQSEFLLLPDIQAYEPLARFWDSLLTLATEVQPRTEDGLIRAFGSGANLWFACLAFSSRDYFAQALTGYPQPRAKKEAIKNARASLNFLNQLGNFRQIELSSRKTIYGCITKQQCICLTTWLIFQAGKIAAVDAQFDARFYRPFIRAFKKVVSSANECKDLQMMWINSQGQLFTTKQSRKRCT